MNAYDSMGVLLRRHFDAIADTRVSDGRLEAILEQTRATAPRPTWLVLALGQGTPVRVSPVVRQLGWLAVALALVVIAIVAVIAAQRPPQVDLGLMAFTQGGDVYLARPDGSAAVRVAHDDSSPLHLRGWSPSGQLLAIDSEGPGTFVLDVRSGALSRVTDGGFIGWAADSQSILADIWPTGPRWVGLDGSVGPQLSQVRLSLPSMSPDGRSVAGVASGRFVIVDLASGAIRDVARAGGYGFGFSGGSGWDYPSWSPDSRAVAFVTVAPGEESTVTGNGGSSLIATVRRDGEGLLVLDATAGDTGRPAWSPDGAWIAYSVDGALRVIRPDGSDARTLVDGLIHGRYGANPYGSGGYAWNPTSARITIFRGDPRGGLAPWQVDLSSGELRPLLVADHAPDALAWQLIQRGEPVASAIAPAVSPMPVASPDPIGVPPIGEPADPGGAWRALALDIYAADGSCVGAVFDLRTANVDIAVPRCWTGQSLGWSPDARLHAGVADVAGGHAVEVTDERGTVIATIPGEWSRIVNAGWSPGGGWIWIQGCADPPSPPSTDIPSGPTAAPGFGFTPGDPTCTPVQFIVRPDGSGLRAMPGMPLWSSDDRRLVVTALDGTVQVGAGDGTDLRSIGTFPGPIAWSPDGTRLAYLDGGDAWVVNADGRGARNVTRFALPIATAVSWSPAADLLAVTQGQLIWLVPADGNAARPLALGGGSLGVTWAPDGSAFVAECRGPAYPSGGGVWCVVPTADGGRPVMLDAADVWDPTWSPDSRFVLFTTNEASASRLLAFRADGGGRTRLDVGGEPASQPRWLP